MAKIKHTMQIINKPMRNVGVLLLITTFALNAMSCGRGDAGVNDQVIAKAEQNLPVNMEIDTMKDETIKTINLQTVSFAPPEGFEFSGSYGSFVKPENKYKFIEENSGRPETEHLVVSYLDRGEDVRQTENSIKINDIESARKDAYTYVKSFNERAQEMVLGINRPKAEVFLDKEIVVKDKYPALTIGILITDNGSREYTREAYVFDSKNTFFYVEYQTKENGKNIQDRFEKIFKSVELNTPGFKGGTNAEKDGYIRRFAGKVTVEVPEDMIPSRSFVYQKKSNGEYPNGKAKEMKLKLREPDDQIQLPKTNPNDEDVFGVRNGYSGQITKETTVEVKSKYYKGKINKYTVLRDGGSYEEANPGSAFQLTTFWTRLEDNEGNAVIIEAESPKENEAEIEADLNKWLETFTPASERSEKQMARKLYIARKAEDTFNGYPHPISLLPNVLSI